MHNKVFVAGDVYADCSKIIKWGRGAARNAHINKHRNAGTVTLDTDEVKKLLRELQEDKS